MELHVPVSVGELLDKISILEIKAHRIGEADKLENVRCELELLQGAWSEVEPADDPEVARLRAELRAVNEELWEIEDRIRQKEAEEAFDADFIRLARSVYITNDRRAELKRSLNLRLGSRLVEEKSYVGYGRSADERPGS